MKHWYYTDWNDQDMTTESGVSARATPSAVGRQSPDSWTRAETTLSTFGDRGSTTPRRTAAMKNRAQTPATLSARCSSIASDQWISISESVDAGHGCYVVAVHDDGQTGDVAAAAVNELCRCPQRALMVVTDDDDDDKDISVRGTTSKNGGRTLLTDESRPYPAAFRRGCVDPTGGLSSSLSRKPKMVVKPNCDQAAAAALHYYDTTPGRRQAKHLQTANTPLDRGDGVERGTGVPDNVASSSTATVFNLGRPSTLPTRCNRYMSTTDAVASLQRPSDVDNARNTYSPRLFFADSSDARVHGNAAVYRVGSYHNGYIGDSEKSSVSRPFVATPTSYGCGRDQINWQISTSGGAGGGDVEAVHGGKVNRRRCACLLSSDGWMWRLVVSTLASFVAGFLVFSAARCYLGSSFPVTVAVAVSASSVLLVALLLSRRCRCVVTLMVPAVSTDRGRAGLVLLTVATLLSGPAINVAFNIREMSRSMTCSADIAYNQTLLLLQVTRVNQTILALLIIYCTIAGHSGAQPLASECPDVKKLQNDGLTRSDTGCFIAVPIWKLATVGVKVFKRLKTLYKLSL